MDAGGTLSTITKGRRCDSPPNMCATAGLGDGATLLGIMGRGASRPPQSRDAVAAFNPTERRPGKTIIRVRSCRSNPTRERSASVRSNARQLVLEQLKLCVETTGSSLENILKVNVYVTSVEMFPAVNEVYRRYFRKDPPARIFVNVPAWNGGFDIEVDCIAAV